MMGRLSSSSRQSRAARLQKRWCFWFRSRKRACRECSCLGAARAHSLTARKEEAVRLAAWGFSCVHNCRQARCLQQRGALPSTACVPKARGASAQRAYRVRERCLARERERLHRAIVTPLSCESGKYARLGAHAVRFLPKPLVFAVSSDADPPCCVRR